MAVNIAHPDVVTKAPIVVSSLLILTDGAIIYITLIVKNSKSKVIGHFNALYNKLITSNIFSEILQLLINPIIPSPNKGTIIKKSNNKIIITRITKDLNLSLICELLSILYKLFDALIIAYIPLAAAINVAILSIPTEKSKLSPDIAPIIISLT